MFTPSTVLRVPEDGLNFSNFTVRARILRKVTAARVLVVEDERPIADLVRLYLSREGFGVHTEHDGAAGLAAARKLRPVACVLDIALPGMDGTATAERIRATHPSTVVVLISIDERIDVPSAAQLARVPLVRKQDFGPGLLRRIWSEHGH